MAKFRKKPVVIEAERISTLLYNAQKNWNALPDWFIQAYENGKFLLFSKTMFIKTLEGEMKGDHTDWLIQGVSGELYPCKPDIFDKTYEAVDY